MNKKIIIVVVILLATVSISGCIKTPMDNINDIIPILSQNIEDGDSNYNEAVKYTNIHDYNIANEKVQNAVSSFSDGQNKILEIKKYDDNINDTIYLQYLDLLEEELSLKQNATANLQLAIQYFESGKKVEANNYIGKANSVMKQGLIIRNQREDLVLKNPNKFK